MDIEVADHIRRAALNYLSYLYKEIWNIEVAEHIRPTVLNYLSYVTWLCDLIT